LQIDDIVIGGDAEVEVKANGQTMSFRTNIVDIKNNSILVNTITSNGQTIGFSDNCQLNFLYKFDGRLFVWENAIVKLVKYDGDIYHKIEIFGEGKPYNRRDSYRMFIGEDMPLYVNTKTGLTALSVLVKDISETGVAFITPEEIDIDRSVRLKLKDEKAIIHLSGIVVRKEFLENLNSFLYGCKFNEKNRNLSRFIAKRQGEQLRLKSTTFSNVRFVKDKKNSRKTNTQP